MIRNHAAFTLVVSFTLLVGCGSSGRQNLTSTGGTSAGGGGGVNTGGTGNGGTPNGGSAGTAEVVCAPVDYTSCPVIPGTTAVVYSGTPATDGTCSKQIDLPRIGTWFNYTDKTVGSTQTAVAELNGHLGTADCGFHSTGMGFAEWGAGFGFAVNNLNGSLDCKEDASAYAGVTLWIKGTADATRTQPDYASAPNTIHVKFVTSTCRHDDDFGAFCTLDVAWTQCDIPFSSVIREGFRESEYPVATDVFDPENLTKIQFQLDKFGTATDPNVNYDVWVDEITFY